MKIKKCLAGFMILVITVLLAMPVSAAETTDKPKQQISRFQFQLIPLQMHI